MFSFLYLAAGTEVLSQRPGRSYVELEHQYAAELSKPMFALVIHEDGARNTRQIQRQQGPGGRTPKRLNTFREQVPHETCNVLDRFERHQTLNT